MFNALLLLVLARVEDFCARDTGRAQQPLFAAGLAIWLFSLPGSLAGDCVINPVARALAAALVLYGLPQKLRCCSDKILRVDLSASSADCKPALQRGSPGFALSAAENSSRAH